LANVADNRNQEHQQGDGEYKNTGDIILLLHRPPELLQPLQTQG
jgi:hypothetical protein